MCAAALLITEQQRRAGLSTVGAAHSLAVDWLGWGCYLFPHHSCVLASFRIFIICI